MSHSTIKQTLIHCHREIMMLSHIFFSVSLLKNWRKCSFFVKGQIVWLVGQHQMSCNLQVVTHLSSEKLRSRVSNEKLFSCWYGQAIRLKVHWRLNYAKRKLKIQAMMCWFWNTRFDLILKVSIFICDWNTWTWFGSIVFKSIQAHTRSSDYSTERKLYSGRG